MIHRDSENIEVARWKKKFLDALEVHDTREKSLNNRIKLLRRGLVGVSLAGDGLDVGLDRELSSLRAALRSQDSESGLEVLLERIEKSVLRLDSRKEQSIYSLQNALTLSVKQLQDLSLPRDLKRAVKQYAKSLQSKIKDPQSHPVLIVDFLELLRMVIRELSQTSDAEAAQEETSFWSRLFTGGPEKEKQDASPVPQNEQAASPSEQTLSEVADKADKEPEKFAEQVLGEAPAKVINASNESRALDQKSATVDRPDASPLRADSNDISPEASETELEQADRGIAIAQTQTDDQDENDTESEPGFSAIANHAEPALLRILDNIYVPEKSTALAAKVRAKIKNGLNWYEFVSVLEDIYALLSAALDEERSEFQRFLSELNQSLEQVQDYVLFSKEQEGAARESERALDEAVRTQISGISDSVQMADNIGDLKSAVQNQLGQILSSMDTFKDLKRQQQESANEHSRQLEARLASLEEESKELRLHLAQQEKLASRDALTELPNRAAYDHRVQEETVKWRNALAKNATKGLCLGVCDVDHFKKINDNYGHLAGDKVLKILAKEISGQLDDRYFVARYGGEEFTILMPETGIAEAEAVLSKIREKIERCPFHFKENKVQITMSFGLSEFSDTDTPEKVFERADKALYRAKKGGRNQVCVANPVEYSPKQ